MIYFRNNGETIEKYEIIFDKAKLQELRKRVAIRCGEKSIVKKECKYCYIPMNDDFHHEEDGIYHYYNEVQYGKSGNKTTEWDHYDEYEVDLYNCRYNDYLCPRLFDFIGKILVRETSAIAQIFSQDFKELITFPKVKEKIVLLQGEIASISESYVLKRKEKVDELHHSYEEMNQKSGNLEKRIKKLRSWATKTEKELLAMDKKYADKAKELNDRLKYLLSIAKLNENQEDLSKYVEELLSLIEIRLVDTISLDLINRVRSFQSQEVPVKEAQLVKQN